MSVMECDPASHLGPLTRIARWIRLARPGSLLPARATGRIARRKRPARWATCC